MLKLIMKLLFFSVALSSNTNVKYFVLWIIMGWVDTDGGLIQLKKLRWDRVLVSFRVLIVHVRVGDSVL